MKITSFLAALLIFLEVACCSEPNKIVAKDVYYFKGQQSFYLILENKSGLRFKCQVSENEYDAHKHGEIYRCEK